MKKLLLFILFCLTMNYVNAQNEMLIYKSDGSCIKYNTSEIDSIKFQPIQEQPDPEPEPEPEPDDEVINIAANQLVGYYYGESFANGLGLYWIILSDNGFVNGELAKNSEFFRIELLGPLATSENNIRIPDGRYTLDLYNNFEGYSIINIGNSDYAYTDNDGVAWATEYSQAELNVNGNSLTLDAVVGDKKYHITFNNNYEITYNKPADIISTLKTDKVIDLSNCTGKVSNCSDSWSCGYCNWYIVFESNEGWNQGTYLALDFLTDDKINGSSGFEGTYRASGFSIDDPTQPEWAPYTFVPGMFIDDNNQFMMGSLVQEYSYGSVIEQAPLFDGEFTITANGDGTHTIIINAIDDATPAHKITLNWTGVLQ